LTGARWHGGEDQEVVPSWHASTYLGMLIDEDYIACASVVNPKPNAIDPESSEDSTSGKDIYDDKIVVEYLCNNAIAGIVGAKERDRILQRAKRFHWEGSHILWLWEDGRVRLVPHPSERANAVRHAHEELGHFGVKRTYSLLQTRYWWHGMQTDVQQFVSKCMVCD